MLRSRKCTRQRIKLRREFISSVSEDRLETQRYSSWSKLTRVSVGVSGFLENFRFPAALQRGGTIQPDEVSSAGMPITIQTQEDVFKEEIRAVRAGRVSSGSKLQPLKPVLDEDRVLQSLCRVSAMRDPLSHHPALQPLGHDPHNQASP